MILAERDARLDRIGVDPVVDELDRDDVLGFGEGCVGGVLVAHHQRDGDVAGILVPHRRRAGLDRVLDRNDRRQRLVIDLDQLGGIARLRQRFGDDEGDAVADRAHLAAGQDRARRAVALRSAHILRHHRHQAAELVGGDVGAGQHGEHARRRLRLGGVGARDPGMRVRRHHHNAVGLEGQVDIVDIAAAPGDEARILQPAYRLTNAKFLHHLGLLEMSDAAAPLGPTLRLQRL